MTRYAALLALLVLLVVPAGRPARAQSSGYVEPPNITALAAAANKEGTLELQTAEVYGGAAGAKAIQDAINDTYHINLKINYSPISGGVQFTQQLVQEVKAGQPTSADVLFGVYAATIAPYMQTIDWRKYVPSVPEDDMYYGKRAVGVYAALLAYDYNPKLIPPGDTPHSFSDLLKPEFKGHIATSAGQAGFLPYIGTPQVLGHQGMIDYLNKFMDQVSGIMNCSQIDRVVSGEFWIFGIDCGDYEVHKRQRKGESIAAMYPREGTLLNYVSPGVPLTSAHPNAARLFIAFLLTRRGQDLLWDIAAADNDKLPGSHMARLISGLRHQGVKIIDGVPLNESHAAEFADYAREIGKIVNQGR